MHHNHTPPTGRENTIILYCRACDYEQDPHPLNQASVSYCPECREHGRWSPFYFVRYEDGAENEAARKAIDDNRQHSKGQ